MKNSADLGECYPGWFSASVDNTILDLRNYYILREPNSIIDLLFVQGENEFFDFVCSLKITQPLPQIFSGNGSIICYRVALLTNRLNNFSGLHF